MNRTSKNKERKKIPTKDKISFIILDILAMAVFLFYNLLKSENNYLKAPLIIYIEILNSYWTSMGLLVFYQIILDGLIFLTPVIIPNITWIIYWYVKSKRNESSADKKILFPYTTYLLYTPFILIYFLPLNIFQFILWLGTILILIIGIKPFKTPFIKGMVYLGKFETYCKNAEDEEIINASSYLITQVLGIICINILYSFTVYSILGLIIIYLRKYIKKLLLKRYSKNPKMFMKKIIKFYYIYLIFLPIIILFVINQIFTFIFNFYASF